MMHVTFDREMEPMLDAFWPPNAPQGGWDGLCEEMHNAWRNYLTADASWPSMAEARSVAQLLVARPKGHLMPRLSDFVELLGRKFPRNQPEHQQAEAQLERQRLAEAQAMEWFGTLPADGRDVLLEAERQRPFAPRTLQGLEGLAAWRNWVAAGRPDPTSAVPVATGEEVAHAE